MKSDNQTGKMLIWQSGDPSIHHSGTTLFLQPVNLLTFHYVDLTVWQSGCQSQLNELLSSGRRG